MCKPKPGPRCAAHTRISLDVARQQLSQQNAKCLQLLSLQSQSSTAKQKKKVIEDYQKAEEELKRIKKTVIEAQMAYDSTPKGQGDLRREIENYNQQITDLKSDTSYESYAKQTELQDTVNTLSSRLDKAVLLRKKQVALYKNLESKSKKILGYKIGKNATQQEIDIIINAVGKQNVFLGKQKKKKKNDKIRDEHLYQQKRIDKLLSYFQSKDKASIRGNTDIYEAYDAMGLTPGYKLIGVGTFRAAYLDESTGKVIKIPVQLSDSPLTRQRELAEFKNEQYSYAVLDTEELENIDVEYVETQFYVSSKHSGIPVIVQPNLSEDSYDKVNIKELLPIVMRLEGTKGLWDIHGGNVKRNRETGKIVFFDCLDNNLD